MWQGQHREDNLTVLIDVEYDEEIELYIVEVTRGTEREFKTFAPKVLPEDGLMHISDLEKAIKSANKLLKRLKEDSRRKKWVQCLFYYMLYR